MQTLLSNLATKLNEKHPHINYGGCAKVAKIMMEELAKVDISSSAIVLGEPECYTNKPIHTIPIEDLWEEVDFNHVMIKVGKYYFDSRGVFTRKADTVPLYNKPYKGTLGLAAIKYIAKNGNWNTNFNTAELPAIRRIIKRHLSCLINP